MSVLNRPLMALKDFGLTSRIIALIMYLTGIVHDRVMYKIVLLWYVMGCPLICKEVNIDRPLFFP